MKSEYFDIAGIIPWWILFCWLKINRIKANQVLVYDKIVLPIMQRVENIITPPIGKNMVLVGKKR